MGSLAMATALLMVGSLFMAGVGVGLRGDTMIAQRVRGIAGTSLRPEGTSWRARMGRSRLGRRFPRPHSMMRQLRLAGSSRSPDDLAGSKLLAGSLAGGFSAVVAVAMGARLGLLIVPLVALAAYRGPDLILARRAAARQARLGRQIPELAELLLTATEAGLGLPLAMVRASTVLHGPLGMELREAVRQVDLGLSWQEALDRMTGRADSPALRRLTRTLGRSRRLGIPVGSALRSVAGELRAERRAVAEEAARRAPVKMLFPLVFLILPAFLLLTVGPVLLSTLRSLH